MGGGKSKADQIWAEIAKIIEMRTLCLEEGGDFKHLWRRERGVKEGRIFADILYGWSQSEYCKINCMFSQITSSLL